MSHPYNYDYFKWLYLGHWRSRFLRFCDSYPALAYAHGISFLRLSKVYPEVYIQADMPESLIHTHSIETQIEFIEQNATRRPKKILEIGAGRGELSCTISAMGIDVIPIEIASDADSWFKLTGELYFGKDFVPPKIVTNVLDVNLAEVDTIIMVEVLEHIKEEDFSLIWDKVIKEFNGIFIVTNFLSMHPIPIGGDWPEAEKEHCRLIDDKVYDKMCKSAKTVIFRKTSHLVLEI